MSTIFLTRYVHIYVGTYIAWLSLLGLLHCKEELEQAQQANLNHKSVILMWKFCQLFFTLWQIHHKKCIYILVNGHLNCTFWFELALSDMGDSYMALANGHGSRLIIFLLHILWNGTRGRKCWYVHSDKIICGS